MACLGSDHIEPFRNLSQVGSGGVCIDKMTNCDLRLIVPNTGRRGILISVRFIINRAQQRIVRCEVRGGRGVTG